MPFLELFDETLDINSTENYELSLQLSPDGFSISILDTIRNKYILLRSHEPDENKYFTAATIGEIINRDDFASRHYRKVNIVLTTPKFTMVPAPLYDPGKKEEYFTLNLVKEENDLIFTSKVADPNSFVVYSVPKQFTELCSSLYPAAVPCHHTKPLLAQLIHHSKSVQGNYIHIHVEKEFFNLILIENNILKFINTFSYRNISDILYYTLNMFRSKGLGNDVTLHFSGLTEKYDDLWSNFAMYVRNLKFMDPAGNFTFSYVFNEIELHRYINLFSITNCE
jgi:hypothetical protein